MMDFETQRKALVERLVAQGYITDDSVAEAMRRVPREEFLPEDRREAAYVDSPQPIGGGQTISAPHMVAIMTHQLDAAGVSSILEIGTGSGYQAAVLAELAPDADIVSIERVAELIPRARNSLALAGYDNVEVVASDGTLGHPERAPYDRIIVTAAAPRVPEKLVEQLADPGRLLVPVGSRFMQELVAVDKRDGSVKESKLGGCVFVPLIGEDGWES